MDRRIIPAALGAVLLVLTLVPVASAQTESELREEIEALKKGQEQIRKDLAEIKTLLQQRPAQRPAAPQGPDVRDKVFDLSGNPVKGDEGAKVTLVEFTDYQCPFCSRHVRDTYPQIEKEYIATGKIRYATLDLPLETIHPQAFKAAQATHCAEEQGKFWEMHDRLFANQRALEPWQPHAEALGLDAARFEECMSSEKYAELVRKDMAEARKAGATGTPSFVLALTDPEDPAKVKGLSFIRGAQPFASFKAQIDEALSEAEE